LKRSKGIEGRRKSDPDWNVYLKREREMAYKHSLPALLWWSPVIIICPAALERGGVGCCLVVDCHPYSLGVSVKRGGL
jgi:hypothetical protein